MKYINLTPRWIEILTLWKQIVESCNSCKRIHREHYNGTMGDFWKELERMAQGADNYNSLILYLRYEGWDDKGLEAAIECGRRYEEQERMKESVR